MKIASWNVNSVRVRLPTLLDWLGNREPDVMCLQETKVVDDQFPATELERAGYRCFVSGQKTYNGVAILVRKGGEGSRPTLLCDQLPGDTQDTQKRFIAVRAGQIAILNAYLPNGSEVGSDKYAYKLVWLARLTSYLAEAHQPSEPLVLCGDINIAPADGDVHDPDGVRGSIMFSDSEHEALARLGAWGLTDTLRLHTQEAGLYSWWDYRMNAFRRNLGWRIDLIMATAPLAQCCTSAGIDVRPRGLPRPSDHAPIHASFSC